MPILVSNVKQAGWFELVLWFGVVSKRNLGSPDGETQGDEIYTINS